MELYTYSNYRYDDNAPEEGDIISYGDLKRASFIKDVDLEEIKDKETYYLMPQYMSGGDYASSSTVEISNHRVFLKEYKEVPGVFDVCGGFGTFAIAIRLDIYLSKEEIKETIDGLEDYALINEEDLSELEMEKTNEAWDNWTHENAFDNLKKSHTNLENLIEPENFRYYFEMAADENEINWEAEAGGSMYIDIDGVIAILRDRALVKITPDDDLPLLVEHQWVSKYALTVYENRLNGSHVPSEHEWDFQLEKEEERLKNE